MELSTYQGYAARTAGAGCQTEELRRLIAVIGLVGEAGELGNLVKKQIGHGHPISLEEIADELGDVLWYAAEVATAFGLNLDQVAEKNVEKLRKRYPNGFSTHASIHRAV